MLEILPSPLQCVRYTYAARLVRLATRVLRAGLAKVRREVEAEVGVDLNVALSSREHNIDLY